MFRWDIYLKIQAPLLILPESFHNNNSAVVVMDLGQVTESSCSTTCNIITRNMYPQADIWNIPVKLN